MQNNFKIIWKKNTISCLSTAYFFKASILNIALKEAVSQRHTFNEVITFQNHFHSYAFNCTKGRCYGYKLNNFELLEHSLIIAQSFIHWLHIVTCYNQLNSTCTKIYHKTLFEINLSDQLFACCFYLPRYMGCIVE